MRDEEVKDYKKLSDKETIELMEAVFSQKSIQKQLEIIFAKVRYDEDGYLGENYGNDDGKYFVPEGEEFVVCNFIEKKKTESVFGANQIIIEENLKNLVESKGKLYYLHAVLEDIQRKVNANPNILYGFTQSELGELIKYPKRDITQLLRGEMLHSGPFRGALLKGEGAAYSKLKQDIHERIVSLNKSSVPAKSDIILNLNSHPLSFESYLSTASKKIFPYLLENYKNAKPQMIASMVFALIDLNYLAESLFYSNQTYMVAALNDSFETKHSRQALTYNFKKLQHPDAVGKLNISQEARKIKAAFDSLPL